jgi:outer membrane lipoprotein carrier protein
MAYLPLISVMALLAQDTGTLQSVLRRVEQRYNTTKTLESRFEQTLAVAQGRRVTETGVLYLRKPGQMRWEYAQPEGKLFLSNGKQIYYVSPAARRVEVSAVKETDDLRIPLAFLLGKLDFARDFNRFEHSRRGADWLIRAIPKNPKTPFAGVEFLAAPDGRLTVVTVQSKDGSTMSYKFWDEQRNRPLDNALFEFRAPEGYQVVQLRAEP